MALEMKDIMNSSSLVKFKKMQIHGVSALIDDKVKENAKKYGIQSVIAKPLDP